jgi:hypothetical protein
MDIAGASEMATLGRETEPEGVGGRIAPRSGTMHRSVFLCQEWIGGRLEGAQKGFEQRRHMWTPWTLGFHPLVAFALVAIE